jgi:ribosome-binding factor A
VEKRQQKYHRERLSQALREEIATLLEGELADPRIGLVNVSEVHLAPDARSAQVLVAVEGGDEDADRTMEGLSAAVGFIRRELAERLHLRRPPDLVFQIDRSQEYRSRIDQLLKRTRRRKSSGSES